MDLIIPGKIFKSIYILQTSVHREVLVWLSEKELTGYISKTPVCEKAPVVVFLVQQMVGPTLGKASDEYFKVGVILHYAQM